jgi:DNA-directed RNA polymerase specialized sigma24 family protein
MLTSTSQRAFDDFAQMIRASLRRDAYRLCGDWHEAEVKCR